MIAESVNPLAVTRDSWQSVGNRAAVPVVEVEVICSDPDEHRDRVTTRSSDIHDLPLPNWQQVLQRDYEPWNRERLVIDTAGQDPQQSLALLLHRLDHTLRTSCNPSAHRAPNGAG
ncbi:hypothetical protein [Streptomyces sp. NPDC020298]|uniref:hypothetical protein n=1 Tax=unclassified Streptomyces TaxID=2593676 RepID=UPI00340BFDB4